MLHLENSELNVSILDPVADQERLGSRYCTGGYIWQVTDLIKGELVSGPQYPNPNPSGFDGQGLPEVFEIALGQDKVAMGEEVCVIGVGRVRRDSPVKPFHVRNNFTVTEFTQWETILSNDSCIMTTEQHFQSTHFRLQRHLWLSGRKLISTTILKNRGDIVVPLRWFAHPFFPHHGYTVATFATECEIPAFLPNLGGYLFDERGMLTRNEKYPWNKGCYQILNLPFGYPMHFFQMHPLVNQVKIECQFPLAWLPIWANEKTVSLEPYLHAQVGANQELTWSISYEF